MPSRIATADVVDAATLAEFIRPRHHTVLVTTRADAARSSHQSASTGGFPPELAD